MAGQATVRQLYRTSVLLVGRDRRFLRVASLLLGRHGCEVRSAQPGDDVIHHIRQQRTNVVLIDASESLTAAVRTLAAIEALSPSVHVVLVYDGDGTPLEQLRLIPKWGAFSQIVDEIDRVYASGPSEAGDGLG